MKDQSAGMVKVRAKRVYSERYDCAGEWRKNGSLLKEGCGRTFVHAGSCPFCKGKTTTQAQRAAMFLA